MIHGLPFRLSISDCFSVTMISANMTSEYHNNFFASFLKNYLMPSWFHLIRIALNLLFLFFFCFLFVFFLQFVCQLIQTCSLPTPLHFFYFIIIILFFYPFPFLLYRFNYSIFKCLLNNVSLVKAHSGFLLALSPGLCY